MTLSTSAVAVCCCRASSSSRLRRPIVFSAERVAFLWRLTGLWRGIFDRVTRPWRPIAAPETLQTVDRSRRASRLEGIQFAHAHRHSIGVSNARLERLIGTVRGIFDRGTPGTNSFSGTPSQWSGSLAVAVWHAIVFIPISSGLHDHYARI